MNNLLSIVAAAERLGVHRRTVERLIASGRIRSVKIGRLVRVDPDQLAADIGLTKPESERRRKARADREFELLAARLGVVDRRLQVQRAGRQVATAALAGGEQRA